MKTLMPDICKFTLANRGCLLDFLPSERCMTRLELVIIDSLPALTQDFHSYISPTHAAYMDRP